MLGCLYYLFIYLYRLFIFYIGFFIFQLFLFARHYFNKTLTYNLLYN